MLLVNSIYFSLTGIIDILSVSPWICIATTCGMFTELSIKSSILTEPGLTVVISNSEAPPSHH